MLIGNTENIDQANIDYQKKITKIQSTEEKPKTISEDEYKKNKVSNTKAEKEIILDNVSFGFNSDTNDFFVRVKKQNVIYQYPTEDMMKLKKNLKEIIDKI